MEIKIVITNPTHDEYGLPEYATPGSAGVDIRSMEPTEIVLRPGETHKFNAGFKLDMGDNEICAYVVPRSGLGSKQGLVLANTIGVIDSDYQGDIICVAMNRNQRTWRSSKLTKALLPFCYEEERSITIKPGDRIFQLIFAPVSKAKFVQVDTFDTISERGEGGFGSTNTKLA